MNEDHRARSKNKKSAAPQQTPRRLSIEALGGDRYRVVDPAGSGEPHIVSLYPTGPVCGCADFQFGKRKGVGCKHTDGVSQAQAAGESIPPAVDVPSTAIAGGPGLMERDVPPPEPPMRAIVTTPASNGDSRAADAAEQAVLSSMLLAHAIPPAVRDILPDPRSFQREAHRLLYQLMLTLSARGEPIDPVTLSAVGNGELDRAGGMEYVASLIDVVPTAGHVEAYARAVREFAQRREMAALGRHLQDAGVDLAGARITLERLLASLASSSGSRFHFLTIDELLALPPPTWLLEQYLPANALSVLYGAPSSGKTFLSVAWALAIAAGRPWLSHPTAAGRVIYCAAEGGTGMGQRVRAYCNAHEISEFSRIQFIREAVNLLEPTDVDALLAGSAGAAPALFVFDTMSRSMVGGDENSAMDVGRAIAATDRIRQETGAAVLLVHHTQKTGDLERGSSALRGAADAMFSLSSENAVLTLTCTKQKDSTAIGSRQLRLAIAGASCVIEPLEGAPAEIGPTVRQLLRGIQEVSIEGETTASILIDSVRLSKPTVYRSLKLAVEHGYVRKRGAKYSLTPSGEAECLTSLTGVSSAS